MTFSFLFILILISLLSVLVFFFLWIFYKTKTCIFEINDVPYNKYTLVLGAGLEKNGLPTDILSDRVKAGVYLLERNKTSFLVLSGSLNTQNFSEAESMRELALSLGAKNSNLIIDNQGKTTFDSMINLLEFSKNDGVTIVTQRFHLPRALWLANALNINSSGFPANIYKFSLIKTIYWYLREIFSLPKNIFKLFNFYRPMN